jgi:hypothetical protein
MHFVLSHVEDKYVLVNDCSTASDVLSSVEPNGGSLDVNRRNTDEGWPWIILWVRCEIFSLGVVNQM